MCALFYYISILHFFFFSVYHLYCGIFGHLDYNQINVVVQHSLFPQGPLLNCAEPVEGNLVALLPDRSLEYTFQFIQLP